MSDDDEEEAAMLAAALASLQPSATAASSGAGAAVPDAAAAAAIAVASTAAADKKDDDDEEAAYAASLAASMLFATPGGMSADPRVYTTAARSVKELKARLATLGVSAAVVAACVEKAELEQLLAVAEDELGGGSVSPTAVRLVESLPSVPLPSVPLPSVPLPSVPLPSVPTSAATAPLLPSVPWNAPGGSAHAAGSENGSRPGYAAPTAQEYAARSEQIDGAASYLAGVLGAGAAAVSMAVSAGSAAAAARVPEAEDKHLSPEEWRRLEGASSRCSWCC